MPKRLGVNQIPTPELQGDDSYVVFRRMTIEEMKQLMRENGEKIATVAVVADQPNEGDAKPSPSEIAMQRMEQSILNIDVTEETLAKVVIDWNWVDEDGNELPKPKGNPDVFSKLFDHEFQFLAQELGRMMSPAATDQEKK